MGDWSGDWSPEGPTFLPEMGVFNRVGGGIMIGTGPKNRMERAMMDPLDRFRINVDAISRNLNNWDGINISEESIQQMLEKSDKLLAIEHKSPSAYVLGYLATGSGNKLTKRNFDYVINKVLPYIEEGSVLPPDVIRYAKLWETL